MCHLTSIKETSLVSQLLILVDSQKRRDLTRLDQSKLERLSQKKSHLKDFTKLLSSNSALQKKQWKTLFYFSSPPIHSSPSSWLVVWVQYGVWSTTCRPWRTCRSWIYRCLQTLRSLIRSYWRLQPLICLTSLTQRTWSNKSLSLWLLNLNSSSTRQKREDSSLLWASQLKIQATTQRTPSSIQHLRYWLVDQLQQPSW